MTWTASIYDYLYRSMPLHTAGLLTAVFLIILHGILLLRGESLRPFLAGFHRNYQAGVVLLFLGFLWVFLIWSEMDLGEFFHLESKVQFVLIAGFALFGWYVRDYLSVRALGLLMVLAPGPLLQAALLEPPTSRLLLVALCYVWLVAGMFFVGMPYLFRDLGAWVLRSPARVRFGALAGLAYGVLMVLCVYLNHW